MTELIWEGKYDAQRRKIAQSRIALPFQTVETVNESAVDRQRNQELFATNRPTDWRNRLIWGDKKYVLPSLLEEFGGKVDLIYIDPPFNTGGDFSFTAEVPAVQRGAVGTSFVKEPSIIEQKAYRDTWGKGLESYFGWFADTITLLRELLSENGTLFVHLDWNVVHSAKIVLDEVFGEQHFRNEIIWYYTNKLGTGGNTFDKQHDSLLVYVRGDSWVHNALMRPVKLQKPQPVTKKIEGARVWLRDDEGNRIYEMGKAETKIGDVWEIPYINPVSSERLGYATQKPEALLASVIRAASEEGSLVLDCFVGSGTTAAVAERLNRRWIACDLGRFAIHTTRKRLLGIPGVKPFVVQNLGKYERQAWQVAEFGERAEAATQAYRQFVLDLYHAQSVAGYIWLHGNKAGRMVHVGGVDAPVTLADVTGIVIEFRKAVGTGKDAPQRSGVDILGWDFAFELNETARQKAELAGIDLRLIRIPREVLEKKAVEQGDIKFFELAALDVKVTKKATTVTLELKDFIIPLDDVPEDVQKAITHWEQWIDYWAVDWDNSDDTFHNEWQTYRTRKDKTLARSTSYTYAEAGKYRVVVKVIDILGNDTTKLLQVEVK